MTKHTAVWLKEIDRFVTEYEAHLVRRLYERRKRWRTNAWEVLMRTLDTEAKHLSDGCPSAIGAYIIVLRHALYYVSARPGSQLSAALWQRVDTDMLEYQFGKRKFRNTRLYFEYEESRYMRTLENECWTTVSRLRNSVHV